MTVQRVTFLRIGRPEERKGGGVEFQGPGHSRGPLREVRLIPENITIFFIWWCYNIKGLNTLVDSLMPADMTKKTIH